MRQWMWTAALMAAGVFVAGCNDDDSKGFDQECTAVYELEVSTEVSGTPAGAGDSVAEGHTGQVALRYGANAGEETPADGAPVEVLHYFTRNDIDSEPVEGLVISTRTINFSPTCNGETDIDDKKDLPERCDFDAARDKTAYAVGAYDADSERISWDCTPPEEYEESPVGGGYEPEHEAAGEGCLKDHRMQGNIHCDGSQCHYGGIDEGDNEQDEIWVQVLSDFELSDDGKTLVMDSTRTPTRLMSGAYLWFTGERTSIDCE